MAPQYKLHYFNSMGAAEPVRWILAYAKVEYEDIRVEKEDWPAKKSSMPWGQLPVLEIDGQFLAQSSTMARYLSRKYGLVGDSDLEAAKIDECNDAVGDLKSECRKYFYEQDEAKKEEEKNRLATEVFPNYFTKFDAILSKNGSGFLVGKKLSFADISLAYAASQLTRLISPTGLDNFPEVKKHSNFVQAQPGIKEWIAKRPATQF